MSAYRDSLIRQREILVTLMGYWMEAQLEAGAPISFQVNVEGESYDFSDWLLKKTAELKALDDLIRVHSPFAIRSRQRG